MQKANQKLTGVDVFPVMCWPSSGAQAEVLVLCCASPSKGAVIILKSTQSKVWSTDEFCTLGRSSCLSEKTCLGGFSNAFSVSRVACWLGENWRSCIWCLLCRVSAAPCSGVAVGWRSCPLCSAGNISHQGGGEDLGPLRLGGVTGSGRAQPCLAIPHPPQSGRRLRGDRRALGGVWAQGRQQQSRLGCAGAPAPHRMFSIQRTLMSVHLTEPDGLCAVLWSQN